MPTQGLPEVDDISAYGGLLVDEAPVTDATTEQSAAQANLIAQNVAGMTHTACRAWRCFLGTTSNPVSDPATNVHDSVWGNSNPVKPSINRVSTGIFDITWPATTTDARGVQHTTNIRRILNVNIESTTLFRVQATITGANTVRVSVWNSSNAANDAAGAPITVFWI